MRLSRLFTASILVCALCIRLAVAQDAAPKLTQSQAIAAFDKASAALDATKASTQERGDAAVKARQLASDVAWIEFDAGKHTEAAIWFERASTLQKEANAANRSHWENDLRVDIPKKEAELEKQVKSLNELAKTADAQKKPIYLNISATLQRTLLIMRYNAVSMLQNIAHESNDDAAWLGYKEEELRIRRAEMTTLTQIGASANEIDRKTTEIAKALEGIAWAQEEMARLSDAEKNNLEALALRQALPADLPERGLDDAYEALGYFYLFYQGDLVKARQNYEKALIELEKSTALKLKKWESGAPYTPELIAAMAPKERAEYDARHAEQKSANLALAAMSRSGFLTDLSIVARKTGDFRGAIALATRALEVADTLPAEQNMWFGIARGVIRSRALSQLTILHSATGEMALALKDLDQSIQIKREMGDNHSAASLLQQAGTLLFDQDKFAEAKPYLEQARRLFVGAQNLNGVINSTDVLARLAREAGSFEAAASLSTQSLELARKTGVATSVAGGLRVLASIKLRQNLPTEAAKLLDEAQVLDARNISVTDKIFTLSLQGQTLEAQGQNDGALVKYREAVALLEGVRSTAPSENNFSNVKANYQLYERLVRLLVKQGRGEEAFDYLGRAKSKQLQDTLSLATVQSKDAKVRANVESATTLDAKLRAIIAQLQSEFAKPADQQNPERIRNLQIVRAQTQGDFFAVLDELKKSGSKFDVRVEPADIKAIKAKIPADAALVQYVPLGEKLYIFFFTKTKLKIIETPTKPDEVWKLVQQVRPQLARDGAAQRGSRLATVAAPLPTNAAPIENNLTALYDLLIAPIEADIADKSTLAFIPTQWLYYLPMQALAKKQDGKLRYLMQDKNVVYLATTSQINRAVMPRATDELGKGLLAFGDPTGANLPAAQLEVKTIGQVFPDSTVFSGAQVIKTAVMNDGNWDRRILHFATHGILNSQKPDESYIQLAPGKTSSDGELTVHEIQNLPLEKIDVVTLSACQTALGEGEPGSEVMTLAGAFERAGAYSIVASLWSVSDDSTKDLMVEFYTQLAAGKSKAEAIRLAQLKVMQNPDFAAPYYWAPFILMGDWR